MSRYWSMLVSELPPMQPLPWSWGDGGVPMNTAIHAKDPVLMAGAMKKSCRSRPEFWPGGCPASYIALT